MRSTNPRDQGSDHLVRVRASEGDARPGTFPRKRAVEEQASGTTNFSLADEECAVS